MTTSTVIESQRHCPSCGWPAAPDTTPDGHPDGPGAASAAWAGAHAVHASSGGPVGYLRCPCGRWLILQAGRVIAAAGTSDFGNGTPGRHHPSGHLDVKVP